MCVDIQQSGFWWVIRAHGIIEEMPEVPTWTALIDYGGAVSWEQIEEFAGIKAKADGTRHEFRFGDTAYRVSAGLIDSGFEAMQNKKAYDFCEKNQHVFSPSKGGGWMQLRGQTIRQTPVYDDRLELISYEDNTIKQQLYYNCIKERKEQWWLPRDICRTYRAQLTSEHTEEKKQHDGSLKLEWIVSGPDGNHLGDCEKMTLVLGMLIEAKLADRKEEIIEARAKSA
jgi:hypothetical protein